MSQRRQADVLEATRALLEASGPEAVTMRAIADHLGIRASSLYKQFSDKAAIERQLIAAGLDDQSSVFEVVLMTDQEPIEGVLSALRTWALAHRHLYRLMADRPIPAESLPPAVEARQGEPVMRAFRGDADLARAGWAFANGLVSLEIDGRFPRGADIDAAWSAGIAAFVAASDTRCVDAPPTLVSGDDIRTTGR